MLGWGAPQYPRDSLQMSAQPSQWRSGQRYLSPGHQEGLSEAAKPQKPLLCKTQVRPWCFITNSGFLLYKRAPLKCSCISSPQNLGFAPVARRNLFFSQKQLCPSQKRAFFLSATRWRKTSLMWIGMHQLCKAGGFWFHSAYQNTQWLLFFVFPIIAFENFSLCLPYFIIQSHITVGIEGDQIIIWYSLIQRMKDISTF